MRSPSATVLLAAFVLAGACASEPQGDHPGIVRERVSGVLGGTEQAPVLEVPDAPPPGERMEIGLEAAAYLDRFVKSRRTLIGDRTVVDMSQTPFLAMTAFSISPVDVERRDSIDQASGVMTVSLRNISGVKTVLSALPRIELGGLLFVGTDELVLRYHMRTDRARPIHLRAVASGRAVYRGEDDGARRAGSRAILSAHVLGEGDAARFAESVEVDP